MKVNSLQKFLKSAVGSTGRIVDYTSIIQANGDLQKIVDLNVILVSWNNILTTPLRTYMFDPEFGSELYKYVFDPADDATMENIKQEIQYRLGLYDDRATITNINIKYLSNRKGFNVDIFVDYEGMTGQITTTINENNLFQLM